MNTTKVLQIGGNLNRFQEKKLPYCIVGTNQDDKYSMIINI